MLTQIIVWAGIFFLFLLLLRGLQARWRSSFPLFYSYVLFVFVETVCGLGLYIWAPRYYAQVYWICQFVAIALGSLVLFEIYRVALRPYPGTARLARNLLFLVFCLAFAKVLVNHSYGSLWWPAQTYQELERNLRVVQAFAVVALVIVMVLYTIPRDRHLKGILAGYGLFVASSIVQLSMLSYVGSSFQPWLVYLQPLSYDVVLCIWTVALWSPLAERSHSPSLLEIAAANHPALVTRAQQDLQDFQLDFPGGTRR